MALETLQYITLFSALILLVSQLLVPKKQTTHILFAIFCGSVATQLTKDITGNSIGALQYLIAIGTCATCNCYWLLSRSLFRTKNAITAHHLILAGAIAMLILLNQGYLFAQSSNLIAAASNDITKHMLREVTILLSSCILVLTFWEGCRNFSSVNRQQKTQRLLFLSTFAGAIITAKIGKGFYVNDPQAIKMVITTVTLMILVNTQIVMLWRFKGKKSTQAQTTKAVEAPLPVQLPMQLPVQLPEQFPAQMEQAPQNKPIEPAKPTTTDEPMLANEVKSLITDNELFLQANLKVADIARKLNVPEYRVSNALRRNLNARNFNHYINQLRIKHAQTLLADSEKQKWSVLVVALESGFASVGPFTRAFKATTGFTPNQYRKSLESGC